VENACNELQSIRREKLDMLYEFRNEKRLLENDIQSTRKNISDLKEAQRQMQQTFDNLLYRTNNLRSRAESLQQFIARFKRTNKDYVKIREVAEDYIRSVLAEEDKSKLLSVALNSVVEVLRQNPDLCASVVFNDNNNENKHEYQNSLLILAKSFFNTFVNQTVGDTMNTLEAEETEDTEE
jgi:hypothetical protein